jgi:hypothetical protein
MPNLLELQDLYNESLVREIFEKTKACGLTWNSIGTYQFHSTHIDSSTNNTWDFYVTMTPVGNSAAKWNLDIKKDSVAYISIQDGPLPVTGRNSLVQQLYEVVEIIVLQLDSKLKETLQLVQNMPTCSTGA